ncbi:TPA: hypothetical protein DDW69_03770 [candidate division CPR2 bacterium]|uniref:Uncharacterized protein n=1 Tax=candidate division CPR2 bacterium GW2011_GWC1_41_48 TaxID=1618344 RepID=A0A0G0YHE8_UNCC2|nr:MAG: hypothetical protein UT47_C0003G0052 [candidate division CPR2 bacterium GW2011_GWC2_39_35]KKR29336.1 MAG: hypothetical protein UT60_C0003G0013 [candidate division CPR2 bacterium GW2011_GWD2_39_7]KKS08991.1 MAG: hypothetical protein UU65_C0003G0046 [candidate division CPR2 bacterium GW2011_GWC1_41_48]OGB61434.1 MAG: hypothetical protein A2Y27_03740 [candidate division CPR2 bacterium GWD1_39_7]OGB71159.1 MAG: hypothetical protein A2Y26_04075 [candidate division CPR2 bacterium GWD2_39_7]H
MDHSIKNFHRNLIMLSILILIIEIAHFFVYPIVKNYSEPLKENTVNIQRIDIKKEKAFFAKLETLQDKSVNINEPVKSDEDPFTP